MYRKDMKIHFVGIGGAGMSGIAEVLINLGYKVSGSDIKETEITRRLEKLGAKIYYIHSSENVTDADIVVYSSAIKKDNVELVSARQKSIPVIPRAEMLAELMRMKYSIAVAGTHGKTTTTSMIATLLWYAGYDPTAVIGGKLNSFGSNARLGSGEFLVAEADESDGTFLKLYPTVTVVTNIDPEHLDHYKSYEKIKESFVDFINRVPFYGFSVLCIDNPGVRDILKKVEKQFFTYGIYSKADCRAENITLKEYSSSFDVFWKERYITRINLKMPGIHNVLNSLSVITISFELGIDTRIVKKALEEFSGVQRRFQIKFNEEGIIVIDDYGHHPEEIKATLKAAKDGWGGRTIVIFQPHRYTRTYHLFDNFINAFDLADILFITDIYPAGEDPIEDVSGMRLAKAISDAGHRYVRYIRDWNNIIRAVLSELRKGDMIITLGAGDIWQIGNEIVRILSSDKQLGS